MSRQITREMEQQITNSKLYKKLIVHPNYIDLDGNKTVYFRMVQRIIQDMKDEYSGVEDRGGWFEKWFGESSEL